MKFLSTISLLILLPMLVFGQTEEENTFSTEPYNSMNKLEVVPDIQVLSKSSKEGIHFRWAPTNINTWNMGNTHGYTFELMGVNSNEFRKVSGSNIKPWPKEDFKPYAESEDKYMLMVGISLYDEADNELEGFVPQANDFENRYVYTLMAADFDKKAAEAAGLYYLQTDTTEASYGIYRIYTFDPETNESSDTTYVPAGYSGEEIIYAPEVEINQAEGSVEIEWSGGGRPFHNEKFTAFHIEKSTDTLSFKRIHEQPFVNAYTDLMPDKGRTSLIDSVENGIKYYYRVIGIDAFGDLSEPSKIVSGMGVDETPPTIPISLDAKEIDNLQMQISWKWENIDDAKDMAGFNIYRSFIEDGTYEKINSEILPVSSRAFIDKNPETIRLNYYYVEAVDESGNGARSVYTLGHIVDLIPPQPPTNLVAEIDSNGLILLEWTPPTDLDIKGYELYFSNHIDYEFIKKGIPIINNEFYIDSTTLKTLTKELYYKVVAVDYNYNRSDFSEMTLLMRPDIIPPSASIFESYEVTNEGIAFTWITSTSDDVASIVLERRVSSGPWELVKDFDAASNSYLDKNVKEGLLYEYNLITTDESNNISMPEKILILEGLKSFYLEDVKAVRVIKKGEKVLLSWKYPDVEQHQFVVYKTAADGVLETYRRVEGQTSITLKYKENEQYKFAVKAQGNDGRESPLSKIVSMDK